ncbi:cell envelope integrity EipB family protein [Falsiroseomonas oryziterrae]|uniref:cell envelope integrity EipB family protein n=1 Tax=Falsiroseomonas oryziterrae TaxID=2911368 RepID=UPI001F33A20F|nr:cell envelope integrity EipB family protein [Roseomonas sp. NPKOSM-4]
MTDAPIARRLLGLVAALALSAGPASAQAPVPAAAGAQYGVSAEAITAGVARMVAHRAAYRLDLGEGRNSGITAVRGAMVFDVQDACEGWATRQRMTMTVVDRDGQEIETVSDYATFEAKDNSRLRFSLTQSTGGAISQRVAGEAELRSDGSGSVRYTEPAGKEEALPAGTMLPTRHTVLSIEVARAGRRILAGPLFDGTSDEGVQDTTTVISGWQATPQEPPRFPLLAGQASARMRIAFFERGAATGGASQPEYEVGLRYFENGVADDLVMDFGEFSVTGRLLELTAVPGGC